MKYIDTKIEIQNSLYLRQILCYGIHFIVDYIRFIDFTN